MKRLFAMVALTGALAVAGSAFAGSAGAYPSHDPQAAQAHFVVLSGPWNLSYHPAEFFGYSPYWPHIP